MTSTTLYTLRPVVRIAERGAVHIEDLRDGPGGMFTRTVCGIDRLTRETWHATGEPSCQHCRRIATCARGHAVCGTPSFCATVRPETVPAAELRDGDTVYVTGRWQTLTSVDTTGPMVTAHTDRGGILSMRRASSFARRI
jgi:hypothetical protein